MIWSIPNWPIWGMKVLYGIRRVYTARLDASRAGKLTISNSILFSGEKTLMLESFSFCFVDFCFLVLHLVSHSVLGRAEIFPEPPSSKSPLPLEFFKLVAATVICRILVCLGFFVFVLSGLCSPGWTQTLHPPALFSPMLGE
jgi:hypothetical protein